MRKFIIERVLPGAGKLSAAELRAIATKSCQVIEDMGVPYHWIQTFVTDNKLYCIHITPDEQHIIEHASRGGFPTDTIAEVRSIMDPTTKNESH